VTASSLRALFEPYGSIDRVNLATDRNTVSESDFTLEPLQWVSNPDAVTIWIVSQRRKAQQLVIACNDATPTRCHGATPNPITR
jgi:hypothetical protein